MNCNKKEISQKKNNVKEISGKKIFRAYENQLSILFFNL